MAAGPGYTKPVKGRRPPPVSTSGAAAFTFSNLIDPDASRLTDPDGSPLVEYS